MTCGEEDPLKAYYITSRDVRAVVKAELANFISHLGEDVKIFACEGPDDKVIYYYWFRLLSPSLSYDFFVCKNKAKVLQLYDSLQNDVGGLRSRVAYLIDRDYDDLQGREPSPDIFMTDRYSVESYVVTEEVLEALLTVNFHCNGSPKTKIAAVSLFYQAFDTFLRVTRNLNFRIFLSRKLEIKQTNPLPENINRIAQIELNGAQAAYTDEALCQLVELEREPSAEEEASLRGDFDALDARTRYRGKFAHLFFSTWLQLLKKDRTSEEPKIFGEAKIDEYKVGGNFSFEALASRARPPEGLQQFVAQFA